MSVSGLMARARFAAGSVQEPGPDKWMLGYRCAARFTARSAASVSSALSAADDGACIAIVTVSRWSASASASMAATGCMASATREKNRGRDMARLPVSVDEFDAVGARQVRPRAGSDEPVPSPPSYVVRSVLREVGNDKRESASQCYQWVMIIGVGVKCVSWMAVNLPGEDLRASK